MTPDQYRALLERSDAKTRAQAEAAFQALLIRIRNGEKPQPAIAAVMVQFNEGKDELYQWRRVGDLAQTTAMPKVHPDVIRSGDAATVQAAEALVKALTVPEWGTKKFQAGKMTQRTLDQFDAYQHIPEVKKLIDDIKNKNPVDGLTLHYLKRRYVEKETISSPDDLNLWFSNALQDKDAVVFKPNPGGRHVVYSKKLALLAVFEATGQRVSVYDYPMDYKGDPWCLIQQLII